MTSVNVTTTKNTVTVNGETRVVTVKTQGPQGPSLPDGDKGDVTVSSNGTAISINSNSITSAKIADGAIVNADINASAAIALSKLATGALPTAITVTSANISDLSIVNADINASAAIAGTKISPDFGSQTIATTGVTNLSGELRANGNIKMTNDSPKITFVDAQDNPDFEIGNLNGVFRIRDTTNSANRLVVNTDGHVDVIGNLDVGANISVTGTVNGRNVATDGTKLDGIETGATADMTASEILTLLKTVDGAGSGLNADTLDGISSASFLRSDTNATFSGSTLTVNATLLLADSMRIGDDAFIEDYNAANSVRIKGNQDTSKGFIAFGQQTKQLGCDGTSVLTYDGNTVIDSAYTGALANGITATTQSAGDNSTKIATTAYTDTAISNLVDSSPSTLNTLNELAAALGDDANFSTTVTNSIATKLPLAGGTLTGDLTISNTAPSLYFTDTNHDSDFRVMNQNGVFKIFDQTNSADRLEIYSGGQVVIDGNLDVGSGIDITGTITATSSISVPDAVSIFLGTGNDLSLKHDGSNSFLTNATGYLLVNSTGGDNVIRSSNDVYLQPAGGEFGVKAIANGATELYFDNSKKLETTSYGVLSNQSLRVGGDYILLDNTGDSSYRLNRNDTALFSIRNNNVHNVHLNTQNSATLSFGVSTGITSGSIEQQLRIKGDTRHIQIPNDTSKLQIGAGQDLELYHDGTDSFLLNATGEFQIANSGSGNTIFLQAKAGENSVRALANGATELYYDASKKLETSSAGITVTGAVRLQGTESAYRTGQAQPLIYRSGSTSGSYPFNAFGHLIIQSRNDGSNRDIIFATGTSSAKLNRITSDGHLDVFGDNQKLRIGASQDLEIYHDGTDSFIKNTTGHLKIGDANVRIMNAACDEDMIHAKQNEGVELYYDNSKKLETTTYGAKVTDFLNVGKTDTPSKALELYQASNAALRIQNSSTGVGGSDGLLLEQSGLNTLLVNYEAGNIDFKTANNTRLLITSDGNVQIPNDTGKLQIGASQDVQLFHDGGNTHFANTTGTFKIKGDDIHLQNASGSEDYITAAANGNVELYYDNSKKLNTHSGGITVTGYIQMDGTEGSAAAGNIYIEDDGKLKLGDGGDLEIYHSGSHSFIDDTGTGDMYIRGDNSLKIQNAAGSEQKIVAISNGSVEIYYDHSKKFETKSNGVEITGNVDISGLLSIDDNQKIVLGDSHDLQLYHDGNTSYIKDTGTGNLRLATNVGEFRNAADDENLARFLENGTVELYYDHSKKLETSSAGVQVTGALNVTTTMHIPDGSIGLQIGNSNDLLIKHDGTDSRIINNGSDLFIYTVGDHDVKILADSQNAVICKPDAAVELYYDNVKKLETTSNGVKINESGSGNGELRINGATGNTEGIVFERGGTEASRISHSNSADLVFSMGSSVSTKLKLTSGGNFQIPTDSGKLQLGTSQDIQIYHDGTHSYIENATGGLYIKVGNGEFLSRNGTEVLAKFIENGQNEFYYDNSLKLNTTSTGTTTTGQSKVRTVTAQNSATEYNGQDFGYLVTFDGGSNPNDEGNGICFAQQYYDQDAATIRTGAIIGYKTSGNGSFGGGLKFKVQQSGANPLVEMLRMKNDRVDIPQDTSLYIGASHDLRLVHDGSDSTISNTTGVFFIQNTGDLRLRVDDDEAAVHCVRNGTVQLFHDNAPKLETTANGITVTGSVTTQDMNMSNLNGSANEVDNTKGSWSIQEGSDDLFIINRVTGKKYKFNLTEIS